jgi:hypothetical protein
MKLRNPNDGFRRTAFNAEFDKEPARFYPQFVRFSRSAHCNFERRVQIIASTATAHEVCLRL